jgi:hypothetical protein
MFQTTNQMIIMNSNTLVFFGIWGPVQTMQKQTDKRSHDRICSSDPRVLSMNWTTARAVSTGGKKHFWGPGLG